MAISEDEWKRLLWVFRKMSGRDDDRKELAEMLDA